MNILVLNGPNINLLGMPLLMSSRLGSFFGTSGKLSRRRWPLPSKKLRYFSRSSFKPVHCIGFLSSIVLGVCTSVFMMLWQRGGRSQKQKQPHPIKRDEAAGKSSSVVPPKLQEI